MVHGHARARMEVIIIVSSMKLMAEYAGGIFECVGSIDTSCADKAC